MSASPNSKWKEKENQASHGNNQKASDSDEANRTHGRAGSQASHRLEHEAGRRQMLEVRGCCTGRRDRGLPRSPPALGLTGHPSVRARTRAHTHTHTHARAHTRTHTHTGGRLAQSTQSRIKVNCILQHSPPDSRALLEYSCQKTTVFKRATQQNL